MLYGTLAHRQLAKLENERNMRNKTADERG